MRVSFVHVIIFFLLFSSAAAQTKKPVSNDKQTHDESVEQDYSKTLIRDSAINLLMEIGSEASKLPAISDKVSTKIEVAKTLLSINGNESIKLLESAWQDASMLSKEESENKNRVAEKNKIIALASKISPERAEKWRESLEADKLKTNEADKKNEIEKPSQTARQKADVLLKAAAAKADGNPRAAVSDALASLRATNKISKYFSELFRKLSAKNYSANLDDLKKGLADYIINRPSEDVEDLDAVTYLLSSGYVADPENKHKSVRFLLNSAGRILNGQISAAKPADEVFRSYEYFQIFMRPVISRFAPEDLPAFDRLLKDVSAFIPSDKLDNPLLNAEPPETQIENAEKIVGFAERDRRLSKIVLWILSKKVRASRNDVVRLAQSAADKITNSETKEKLNNFIRIVEIEKLIDDKDFIAAEKTSDKISRIEWRAWVLMVLGKIQEENPSVANEFYDKASAVLQKADNSVYKAQLMFDLASLQLKNNQQTGFDSLSEAAKFTNKAKEADAGKIRLSFFSVISESGIDPDEASRMKINDIHFQPVLGKFALSNWNQTLFISQNIEPLLPRLEFQLLIAKTVLNEFSKSAAARKTE